MAKQQNEPEEVKAPEAIAFTPQQLQEFMASIIREVKKPTEEEQVRIDEEKAKKARQAAERIELARAEEQAKLMKRTSCPHIKPDGRHAFVAQVHSDGYFRPMCTICQTMTAPVKATDEMKTNGVNLNLYQNLTLEKLEAWAKQSEMAGAAR